MAYTFVAVTEVRASTGSTSGNGSVSSTAGNALFCGASAYNANVAGSNLTPSGGGTWTVDVGFIDQTDTNNIFKGSISSCPSATGGSQTLTVSNGNTNGVTAFFYEFSGNVKSGILNSSVPAVAAGTGTTATTNSESNTVGPVLFFAAVVPADGANPSKATGSSAGWSYPTGGQELNGVTYEVIGTGYKITNDALTETSAWAINNFRWDAMIACYTGVAPDLTAHGLPSEVGPAIALQRAPVASGGGLY